VVGKPSLQYWGVFYLLQASLEAVFIPPIKLGIKYVNLHETQAVQELSMFLIHHLHNRFSNDIIFILSTERGPFL